MIPFSYLLPSTHSSPSPVLQSTDPRQPPHDNNTGRPDVKQHTPPRLLSPTHPLPSLYQAVFFFFLLFCFFTSSLFLLCSWILFFSFCFLFPFLLFMFITLCSIELFLGFICVCSCRRRLHRPIELAFIFCQARSHSQTRLNPSEARFLSFLPRFRRPRLTHMPPLVDPPPQHDDSSSPIARNQSPPMVRTTTAPFKAVHDFPPLISPDPPMDRQRLYWHLCLDAAGSSQRARPGPPIMSLDSQAFDLVSRHCRLAFAFFF